MNITLRTIVLSVLLFSPSIAFSCDQLDSAIKYLSPVNAIDVARNNCYGLVERDTESKLVLKGLPIISDAATTQEKISFASRHLEKIIEAADKIDIENTVFKGADKIRIGEELDTLSTDLRTNRKHIAATQWKVLKEEKDGSDRLYVSAIVNWNMASYIIDACGTEKITGTLPEICKNTLSATKSYIRIFTLVENTLLQVLQNDFLDIKAQEDLRLKQWYAYRDEALPQFWWEWAFNGWLQGMADGREIINDVRQGQIPVPNDQIILLHPGIGLQYTSIDDVRNDSGSNANDSELSAALYIEFLGYNRWQWDRYTGGMSNAFGVSIVGVAADNKDADDFSYGLMFHYQNKYSLAVTDDGDGNTGVVINFNLSKLIRDKINNMP